MNEDDRIRVRLCADLIMLAVAEEREACAKLAESSGASYAIRSALATAIRARGAKEGK